MFIVGGGVARDFHDSMEVFDPSLGSWTTSGTKLPYLAAGLRATNINNRVLIFGIDILIMIHQIIGTYEII